MIRWTEIEMTTLNWGEEFDPIDRISKRIGRYRPRALDHSRRHTHSLDFFHLALAHTLTHADTFVHASRVLPDGLLSERELCNNRTVSNYKFDTGAEKKGTGREIWFPVGARLPVLHNAMPRLKITVPCSDAERTDLLPIQDLIDLRLLLTENCIN